MSETISSDGPVVIFIQARMSSSRLPGKTMLDLPHTQKEFKVIDHVVQRCCKAKNADLVCVLTSVDKSDDVLVNYLEQKKVPVFRGPLNNVLRRFYMASQIYKPKYIVRITADCPLIEPDEIDRMIEVLIKEKVDYVCNRGSITSAPDGLDVEVFTTETLFKVYNDPHEPDIEHVTFSMRTKPKFSHSFPDYDKGPLGSVKLSLDTLSDYWLIDFIFSNYILK